MKIIIKIFKIKNNNEFFILTPFDTKIISYVCGKSSNSV